MTKLGGDLPSCSSSSSSPPESGGKAVKMSNFCSIDKLLGKAESENKSSGDGFPANPFKGSHAARLGMRMPGVLEIVNGLQQHKAAAALRGELGRDAACLRGHSHMRSAKYSDFSTLSSLHIVVCFLPQESEFSFEAHFRQTNDS